MEREIEEALLNIDCLDVLTQEDMESVNVDFKLNEDQLRDFNEIFSEVL